jgi:hypothetical protein
LCSSIVAICAQVPPLIGSQSFRKLSQSQGAEYSYRYVLQLRQLLRAVNFSLLSRFLDPPAVLVPVNLVPVQTVLLAHVVRYTRRSWSRMREGDCMSVNC